MAKWFVKNKKADFAAIAEKFQIHPVTARLIRNRDLIGDEMIERFLNGGISELYDPHLLKDASLLVDILKEKIKQGKPIRIIGDYDIDGVMSTLILYEGLNRVNATVSYAIPHRVMDGYGLNLHLIELAAADGIDTILTCDNGISAIKEIAYAKEQGMTVLVTDHHQIPFEETTDGPLYLKSEADAIVNPHQEDCGYPYKELCGAGVAWKVICLLYEAFGIPVEETFPFLGYVGFATVGDVMPLTDENRILVKEGLKKLRTTKNPGLLALIAQCNLNPSDIDTYHLGYVLGPCINAAGRLDTAKLALELFLQEDELRARGIAHELVTLNEERKEKTLEGVALAKELARQPEYEKDAVLVLFLEEVHESIAGIIAGKVRECFEKPTIILTKTEEGVKGSGRSVEGYSMYEELCRCKELLSKFGGHPMAAGLSLPTENVEKLRLQLNRNCSLTKDELQEKIHVDMAMPMDYATVDLVSEWRLLAPFGRENPKPIFADRNLRIRKMFLVGKRQNVLKLCLETEGGRHVNAIFFRDIRAFFDFLSDKFGDEEVEKALNGQENAIVLSVIYAPGINTFQGGMQLQLEIQFYC